MEELVGRDDSPSMHASAKVWGRLLESLKGSSMGYFLHCMSLPGISDPQAELLDRTLPEVYWEAAVVIESVIVPVPLNALQSVEQRTTWADRGSASGIWSRQAVKDGNTSVNWQNGPDV
eukprot:s6495_g1.t1